MTPKNFQTLFYRLRAPLCALVGIILYASPAFAELRLSITKGTFAPIPIAILPFASQTSGGLETSENIAQVITADLEGCGLFKAIDRRGFIQQLPNLDTLPRFADWRLIQVQALLNGTIDYLSDGRVQVSFRLFDIFASRQISGLSYTFHSKDWRRVAHIIADEIYCRLTGESKGYFNTRIVYVGKSGSETKPVHRLAIMDYDGVNHRYLTSGAHFVLHPRASPNGKEISFIAYVNKAPRVYRMNLQTGQKQVLGKFSGMTLAPSYSPDGNKVIMAYSQQGNSSLYLMDLRSGTQTRLTQGSVIDVSPSFSPNGAQIAFESDRSGRQQIYVMNADGSGMQRISFGAGLSYSEPAWSPRGDLIAFTKKLDRNTFCIGVMNPDGSGERIIASGYYLEKPTWSPNGRVIMYCRQTQSDTRGRGRQSQLCSIDVTGRNERAHVTPTAALAPTWTP